MGGEVAVQEAVQEGSRWIHARPSGDVFAKWFLENVRMHEGMNPSLYLPGITLIPASEKVKTKKTLANGRTAEVEDYRPVHTPYAKVDTRLAYFWDLCAMRDWLGEIEKVVPSGALTRFGDIVLPEGFFCMPYPKPDGTHGIQLCCTAKVNIWRRERDGSRGPLEMDPPAATKVVEFKADVNTALRCETGAIGRALGMAGMLVIPGSGVATAEDMQELAGITTTPEDAAVPDVSVPEPIDVRERIETLGAQLSDAQRGEVTAWATERGIDLNEITEVQLRPVLLQIERKLES